MKVTNEPQTETTATDAGAPRQLTPRENVLLTIKVLVGFGVLGAALWGLSLWKSGN